MWVCNIRFLSCRETSPHHDGMGRGRDVWTSGTWSERAGLLSGGNKYCRHQWEMIHLFNVPFPKWNPCNPTDMATSPCVSPLWSLIRAKTVYQCLAPDIYWKWPLVKVIAKAWKGFVMRPWSFSIVWTTATEPGVLMVQYISYISWETGGLRGLSFQTLRHVRTSGAANLEWTEGTIKGLVLHLDTQTGLPVKDENTH